jgi:dTDP-4-amino-4,6-dideoxygalactose transaminase
MKQALKLPEIGENPIQFIDLKAQQERIRPQIEAAINRVLDHGLYIMGPEVAELEKQLAAFCGVKHAISCANGTDALGLALMAKNVGPGDAVFVLLLRQLQKLWHG